MTYPILDAWVGDVVYHRHFNQTANPDGGLSKASDQTFYIQKASSTWQRLLEPQKENLYYEVIRLRTGIPLFWDDHLNRLSRTLTGANINLSHWGRGEKDTWALILHAVVNYLSHPLVLAQLKIQKGEANLKLVVSSSSLTVYLCESYYPTSVQFIQGVPAEVMVWERINPHVKEIRADYKAAVAAGFAAFGQNDGAGSDPLVEVALGRLSRGGDRRERPFEMLLADHKGRLIEGSRSNLFFVRDETVISPPEDLILQGITRKYVLEAITEAGFKQREGLLTESDLLSTPPDGAFISASPIDILPLKRIGRVHFNPAGMELAQTIGAAYQKKIQAVVDRDRDRFEPGQGRYQNLY